jgi:hypothetical protein
VSAGAGYVILFIYFFFFFFLKQSIPNKARLKPLELARVTSGGGEEI